MKKQQINVNHRSIPVFSDRSFTVSHIASMPEKKNKKKAERKEGMIRIIFVDSVSNSSVADVVMTSIAAQNLATGINKSLEKIKKDLKNPKISQPPVQETKPQSYIG